MKKKQNKPNLLDMVPLISPKHEYRVEEDGKVTILIENKGPFNFVAQKLFKKPRITQIHLEEFGSFIWKQIDGTKTVMQIADLLHEEFGEKADPLYPRISMYMKGLINNEFIEFKK